MTATNGLPSQFWNLPITVISNEDLRVIYHTLVSNLRSEFSDAPNYGTLDEMIIERTCFLYVYIRNKEASTAGFNNDRAYKETMQLWDSMADRLRKVRTSNMEDQAVVKARILRNVGETLESCLSQMHVDVAAGLRLTFADAFEHSNL